MAAVLIVGNVVLDQVFYLDQFPKEDSEQRAEMYQSKVGGNAANTAIALSALGYETRLAASLADDHSAVEICAGLEASGVDHSACHVESTAVTPISSIWVNTKGASRTIVHYRDLQEYPLSRFLSLEFDQLSWVHFEGRNVENLMQMIDYLREHFPECRCSLEVEKQRPDISRLFSKVDVIIFSKAYVLANQFANAEAFLQCTEISTLDNVRICAWGEQGSYALDRDGVFHQAGAFLPEKVVDTLAAGDVFNAGIIHAIESDKVVADALREANRLAGEHCAHLGKVAKDRC